MYLYLIKSERNGLWDNFKIGIASDVGRRLAELQTGNPCLLSIESCWQFDNAQAVETVLHQKYGNERVRGEWFQFTPSQVNEFDNLCAALGGLRQIPNEETASADDVEKAEGIAETPAAGKWDFRAMFADGWNIAVQGRDGKYWNWRRNGNRDTIYGGTITSLPNSLEEMRRIYGASESEKE